MLRVIITEEKKSNMPVITLSPKSPDDLIVEWIQLMCDFPDRFSLKVELDFVVDERTSKNIVAARKVMELSSVHGNKSMANDGAVLMGLLCNLAVPASVEQEAKEDGQII